MEMTETTATDTNSKHVVASDGSRLTPPSSPVKKEHTADFIEGKKLNSATESELTASRTSRVNHVEGHDGDRHAESVPVEFVPPTEGTPAALALAANAAIKVSKLDRVTHKFRSLKRPKMKSLNIVKKLNKTTKRKKRHFSKNFKGKVIDGVHELYTLTAGMMLGIRYCVNNSTTSGLLTNEDFVEVENVSFPPKGNNVPPQITPPHSLAHTFKFKSYSPQIFHRIREFFDIDSANYMQSVCGDYNFIEFISNSKSGQFFFYSHDGKYMLKTQTKEENKFLKRILPQYYEFVKKNPNTFLVRILGMHRIKMYHLRRKVHFVIMTSVFDTPVQINTIYDLKGSLIGRSASEKERESGGVLKDMDLLHDKRKIHLGPKRPPFLKQLKEDAKFLASLNIMDYSLLVGIHDRTTRQLEMVEVAPPAVSANINANNVAASTLPLSPERTTTTTALSSNIQAVHSHSNTPFRRTSITQQQHPLNMDANTGSDPEDAGRIKVTRRRSSVKNEVVPGAKTIKPSLGKSRDDCDYPDSGEAVPDMPNLLRSTGVAGADRSSPKGKNGNGGVFEQHDRLMMHASPQSVREHPADNQGISLSNEVSDAEIVLDMNDAHNHSGGEEDDGDYDEGDDEGEEEEEDDDCEYEDIDEGDSDDGFLSGGPAGDKKSASFIMPPRTPDTNTIKAPRSLSAGATPTPNNNNDHFSQQGIPRITPWTMRKDGGINSRMQSKRGNEIYYLGIIDILQEYNAHKKIETMVKGLTLDVRQISSVDPMTYARRFIQFIEANTD